MNLGDVVSDGLLLPFRKFLPGVKIFIDIVEHFVGRSARVQ
jgi:hypothetical protein